MASFVIEGGHKLRGEITPQGAKNEVLQILCATLLTSEEVIVNNIPDILDVNNLIQLLREMGVKVSKLDISTYSFKADAVDLNYLESDEFLKKCSSLRGSVMLVGPLVARFGKAMISKPGGDKIGRRRLDTHFIGMAAMTGSEITIKNVSFENLGIIPDAFRRLGIKMEQRGDDLYIPEQDHYQIESFMDGSIMTIADAPWPGLTPDLLSVILVVATQAKGSVLIHQKMFESRLFFVDKLIDMGAQIILCDPHRAVVIGHDHQHQLRGGNMISPDIRAGIAMLIAAMSAEGSSRIHNIEQIDRGYQNIEQRLNALGARITRI